ncbi:hypothetical protein FLAG1_09143 [Fusarium langsethiae]|uniref:Uncharacterized protein n=1 Tax=Fusarium langsethiae TaxID=179993 RepID=A0A0N1J2E3_FUSLA|nr:hypothetical protein FLAG1_09143 [Fusarium langsethiae]
MAEATQTLSMSQSDRIFIPRAIASQSSPSSGRIKTITGGLYSNTPSEPPAFRMLPSLGEFDKQLESLKSSGASEYPQYRHLFPLYDRSMDQAVPGLSKPTTQCVQPTGYSNTASEHSVSTDRWPIARAPNSPINFCSLVTNHRKARRRRCVKNTGIRFNTFSTASEPRLPSLGHPSKRPFIFKSRHVNQRYSHNEQTYILSSCLAKMTWKHIKCGFDERFGTKPERTIQGLQAWYYRKVKEMTDVHCEEWARLTSTKVGC